jgi:dUTP pyrophosphatase
MKFKVGDKVRVLEDGASGSGFHKDEVVTVSELNDEDFYADGFGDSWFLNYGDVKLVESLDGSLPVNIVGPVSVKFKRLTKDAVTPGFAKFADAGADIVATTKSESKDTIEYGTGLAVEIPEGYFGLLTPRSSVVKQEMFLANSVGIIDSGYRGELKFVFRKTRDERVCRKTYNIGDRIGQLVILPLPKIEFVEVDELSESERGAGGYGSTGK